MDAKTLENKLRSRFLNLQWEIRHKDPALAALLREIPAEALQEIYVLGGFAAVKVLTEERTGP